MSPAWCRITWTGLSRLFHSVRARLGALAILLAGTARDAAVAGKAGLIDPDQKYWWTEACQKGERAAEADRPSGRLLGPFTTVGALKEGMKKRAPSRA